MKLPDHLKKIDKLYTHAHLGDIQRLKYDASLIVGINGHARDRKLQFVFFTLVIRQCDLTLTSIYYIPAEEYTPEGISIYPYCKNYMHDTSK